ncbi:MAG: 2-dehydropantoate 2-reductase [Verrucomicrobiota bacterium]|nr:2-dehydropantoate 2-reductase [Verrucomicrobiota bacterium]
MARVLVVGAGAVGCYFGVQLQRGGHEVTFLARPAQVEAFPADGLRFESGGTTEQIQISATADPSAARDADFILLVVKSYDTAAAARELAPHLGDATAVVCLQNGVTNHELFQHETGHAAIPAVVYVAAQMQSATHLLHNAAGHLAIGAGHDDVQHLFKSAGIPCRISESIESDLWEKLIINCAFNGISALTDANYGAMMNSPLTRQLMEQIVAEGTAVAQTLGLRLELEAVKRATWKVGETMQTAISSTAQDLQRGKRTEIEFLNGHIFEAAQKLGQTAPANRAIYALIKLLETTR